MRIVHTPNNCIYVQLYIVYQCTSVPCQFVSIICKCLQRIAENSYIIIIIIIIIITINIKRGW